MTPATAAPAGDDNRPRPAPRVRATVAAAALTVIAYLMTFGLFAYASVAAVFTPTGPGAGATGQGGPPGWDSVAIFTVLTALGLVCGVAAVIAAAIAADHEHLAPAVREWLVGAPRPAPGTGLIAAGAALVLQLCGHWVDRLVDLATPPVEGDQGPTPVFVGVARSALAGISEELIVLALPLTVARILAPRWLRGWRLLMLMAVLAAARLVYHLYQGWDAVLLNHMLWAAGMVAVYLWCRRVWPLIVQHAAYNLSIIPVSHGWWSVSAWDVGAIVMAAALLVAGLWLRRRTATAGGSGAAPSP